MAVSITLQNFQGIFVQSSGSSGASGDGTGKKRLAKSALEGFS